MQPFSQALSYYSLVSLQLWGSHYWLQPAFWPALWLLLITSQLRPNIGFKYRITVAATLRFPSPVGCIPSRCIKSA